MSEIMTFQKGKLWTQQGQENSSIVEFIQQHITSLNAPLYYLEPALQLNTDGSTGRLKNFQPLTDTLPNSLPELDAAYIFGLEHNQPIGWHIISTEAGCRWFSFSVFQSEKSTETAINYRSYEVLTRGDFQRFFGESYQNKLAPKLVATEYWQETGLLTWWISKGDK